MNNANYLRVGQATGVGGVNQKIGTGNKHGQTDHSVTLWATTKKPCRDLKVNWLLVFAGVGICSYSDLLLTGRRLWWSGHHVQLQQVPQQRLQVGE